LVSRETKKKINEERIKKKADELEKDDKQFSDL